MSEPSRIIVALDLPSRKQALQLVDKLHGAASFFKVGAQLFTEAGPPLVDELKKRDKRVFLDLKFHDIPNTVAGAVRAAAAMGVDMLTVHASGGAAMLAAAGEAAGEHAGEDGPAVVAVTLLTSLSAEDVEHVFGHVPDSLVDEVVRLAGLAAEAGLPGVVASKTEVKPIKRRYGEGLLVVTPGIRLPEEDPADQRRYATPKAAAEAGADYVVVGRSITSAQDPVAALAAVQASFASGRPSG